MSPQEGFDQRCSAPAGQGGWEGHGPPGGHGHPALALCCVGKARRRPGWRWGGIGVQALLGLRAGRWGTGAELGHHDCVGLL
jgi:hypothetical protein